MTAVLEIEGLRVAFPGGTQAVRGISLSVARGETHCLVGESGCGKSATSLAVMGLLARGAIRDADHIRFHGEDISGWSEARMRRLRGNRMAMIFQEPMTSLNPAYTIGNQLVEVYKRHRGATQAESLQRAEHLLSRVGITAPRLRLRQYPHELSGGLRQRVMIAMALMCEPELLIADEPTTALDVTVQAQILAVLAMLQAESNLAILLITHDLGLVARAADRVSVMYAGRIVETGPVADVFLDPQHPYTQGLIGCIPATGMGQRGMPLATISGVVPRIGPTFRGCGFRDRCPHSVAECALDVPRRQTGAEHEYECRLEPGWVREPAA
jgi:peptide/nickel transport system ATP-binding protein